MIGKQKQHISGASKSFWFFRLSETVIWLVMWYVTFTVIAVEKTDWVTYIQNSLTQHRINSYFRWNSILWVIDILTLRQEDIQYVPLCYYPHVYQKGKSQFRKHTYVICQQYFNPDVQKSLLRFWKYLQKQHGVVKVLLNNLLGFWKIARDLSFRDRC